MKITKSFVGPRDPRPKICRSCYAKIIYVEVANSIYRITKHKTGCRMTKRRGMGRKPARPLKQRRLKEEELPVNPLALMKLSPEKFGKKVNQLLDTQY